jgi:hypothetical protein
MKAAFEHVILPDSRTIGTSRKGSSSSIRCSINLSRLCLGFLSQSWAVASLRWLFARPSPSYRSSSPAVSDARRLVPFIAISNFPPCHLPSPLILTSTSHLTRFFISLGNIELERQSAFSTVVGQRPKRRKIILCTTFPATKLSLVALYDRQGLIRNTSRAQK